MEKLTARRNVLALGGLALILGIAHPVLFYEQGIGINFPLLIALIVTSGLLLSRLFARPIERTGYMLLGFALFFSAMIFVRSSELLTFFNVLGTFLLLLIVVSKFAGKHIKAYLPWDYCKVIFLPFSFIQPFFTTLPEVLSLKRSEGDHSKTKEIIRGSIMSVIAVAIFALLFASADAVFEKILSNIFTFELNRDVVNQFILGTITAAFFIGGFGFMFRKLHAHAAPSAPARPRTLGAVETMILLGSINALFLAFILLQLAHLFGGASHLLEQGLTYAEYARNGFFELVWVAILSYLIISVAERQIVKEGESHLQSFKILSGALVAQVVLILVSAFTRLSLYEDAYGFTDDRLYGHAFMIWLGVVLMLLAHHIWTNGERAKFALRTLCSIVLLLFAVNIINPDVFIAKKNLERYAETGVVDATYLGHLSDDALPYTIRLLDDPSMEIRNNFASGLAYWNRRMECGSEGRQYGDWQSLRLNEQRAAELLAPHRKTLEQTPEWHCEKTEETK